MCACMRVCAFVFVCPQRLTKYGSEKLKQQNAKLLRNKRALIDFLYQETFKPSQRVDTGKETIISESGEMRELRAKMSRNAGQDGIFGRFGGGPTAHHFYIATEGLFWLKIAKCRLYLGFSERIF